MGKNNRTEVVRVLREQMEAEKDPRKKVEYAKQLAKLLPRPRQARRPRKTVTRAAPSNQRSDILDRVTGSAVDNLSDGGKVFHYLSVEVEKRRKEREQSFTKEELKALFKELVEGSFLSERERAAVEAWQPAQRGA